ncbi:MAG: FitA-like ribbon-helix-helix domain-containing protein [Gaiellaceae bacterium]
MANIHVRDVPPDVVEQLRAAAQRHRRSLNAEIVEALVERAERTTRSQELLARLSEGRRRWMEAFPEGYPPGLEPETVIRQTRDAR